MPFLCTNILTTLLNIFYIPRIVFLELYQIFFGLSAVHTSLFSIFWSRKSRDAKYKCISSVPVFRLVPKSNHNLRYGFHSRFTSCLKLWNYIFKVYS